MYATAVVQASSLHQQLQSDDESENPAAAPLKGASNTGFSLKLSGFSDSHTAEEVKEHIVQKYSLSASHCQKVQGSPGYCKLFFQNEQDMRSAEILLKALKVPVLSAQKMWVRRLKQHAGHGAFDAQPVATPDAAAAPAAGHEAAPAFQEPVSTPNPALFSEPAALEVPFCDELALNDALATLQSSDIVEDTTSSAAFWGGLTKVFPIISFAELIDNKDKAQRTAVQHLKDMNLSKSYSRLMHIAGKDAGFELIYNCLEQNDCDRLHLLLDIDPRIMFSRSVASGEGGCTIFHAAAKIGGALDCLDVLASKLDPHDRVDVLNTSSHLPAKNTALHHAARSGNLPLVLKLHNLGAITNKSNGDGHTPLDVAAKFNQFEAFRALLSLNRSQKVSVNQVLSEMLKGMDKQYSEAISQHNSNCDRVGLEQRKADFEKWKAGVLEELRSQHAALFGVIELSQQDSSFGGALLLDCAADEKESISRIKCGTFQKPNLHYDVLLPSVFDRSDVIRLQSNLFQGIGFSLSNVATFIDIQEKLSAYESSCPDAQKSAL